MYSEQNGSCSGLVRTPDHLLTVSCTNATSPWYYSLMICCTSEVRENFRKLCNCILLFGGSVITWSSCQKHAIELPNGWWVTLVGPPGHMPPSLVMCAKCPDGFLSHLSSAVSFPSKSHPLADSQQLLPNIPKLPNQLFFDK